MYIDRIKNLYKKGDYSFSKKIYTEMTSNLEISCDISPDEIDSFNLFLRQDIKILEKSGKELIFNFSYANLLLYFIEKKQLRKYFDHIIILFENFQRYLKNCTLDNFDELKLL